MTPDLLTTLGPAPLLGRNFTPQEGDPGGPDVALLTYGFWKTRFAGDPQIVGKIVVINGNNMTIVGVTQTAGTWLIGRHTNPGRHVLFVNAETGGSSPVFQ